MECFLSVACQVLPWMLKLLESRNVIYRAFSSEITIENHPAFMTLCHSNFVIIIWFLVRHLQHVYFEGHKKKSRFSVWFSKASSRMQRFPRGINMKTQRVCRTCHEPVLVLRTVYGKEDEKFFAGYYCRSLIFMRLWSASQVWLLMPGVWGNIKKKKKVKEHRTGATR